MAAVAVAVAAAGAAAGTSAVLLLSSCGSDSRALLGREFMTIEKKERWFEFSWIIVRNKGFCVCERFVGNWKQAIFVIPRPINSRM